MHYTDLEHKYLNLFFKLQKLQWENYAQGAEHNLSVVDAELFRLLSGTKCFPGSRGRVFQAIVQRSLVDKDPDVAALRNRLDTPAAYTGGTRISDSELARAMGPDVLRLMALRNKLSQTLGYNSYLELVFACEELDIVQVVHSLEQFVRTNLPMAKALISKYNIQWTTWFADLRRLGRPVQADAMDCAGALFNALGLEEAKPRIQITVKEQPVSGVAMALNVPEDIRILVRPVQSLAQLATLYHEIGHALGHALNEQAGIFKTWTAVHDETMAITMERIGLDLLETEEKAAIREMTLLEDIRCAVSFLFEVDLNAKPQRAEELYRLHYGRLVADPGDCALWALDTFRSVDPVYIHNYVLGGILADETLQWLKSRYGQTPLAWGTWLRQNWYGPGRTRSLWDKTKEIRLTRRD